MLCFVYGLTFCDPKYFVLYYFTIINRFASFCDDVVVLQYFMLVILIFVLETVTSVLAFIYRLEIENTLTTQLVAVIKEKWSETDEDEEGWREGWAYTQHSV